MFDFIKQHQDFIAAVVRRFVMLYVASMAWNYVVPNIFGLPMVTYLDMICLYTVGRFLILPCVVAHPYN
jgi:hypothetical protein